MLKRNSPKWIRNKKHFELGKGNTGTLSKKRKEFNHICQEYLLSPNFSSGFMCQAVCGSVRSHIWDWQKKLTNFCRLHFTVKWFGIVQVPVLDIPCDSVSSRLIHFICFFFYIVKIHGQTFPAHFLYCNPCILSTLRQFFFSRVTNF